MASVHTVNRILHQSRQIASLRFICSQKIFSHSSSVFGIVKVNQEGELKQQRRFYSLDTKNPLKVLCQSTLIVQDGVDIEELPILIKRATRDSFPFTSHTYSGEKISDESEFDTTFCQVLQNCCSVSEVFKLLEVPSDKVRGFSAAYALQRLHVLKYLNTDWNQIHSFIRSAVMRELYDTVQRDVGLLSNSTLISLVDCYLATDGFSTSCMDSINVEIQCRLGDVAFSMEELLTLANILKSHKEQGKGAFFLDSGTPVNIVSENASRFLSSEDMEANMKKTEHFDRFSARMNPEIKQEVQSKCSELLNNVWIHLISRYPEMNESTLPMTLQALTTDRKHIAALLEKPMTRIWSDLTAEGVGMCLDNLVRLRMHNTSLMTSLGRWAYVNMHRMTTPLLMSFLNTFIHFSFLDNNLIKVAERCLSLKGQVAQTDVIAMCVEYCRSCHYLSPLIMDAAASHFTQHGLSYEPLQLYAVLRAFGQLNYLPSQPSAFLKKAESTLWERFDHLEEAHLLEILGSFTILNVLPKNFHGRVTSEYFSKKLAQLKNPQKFKSIIWLKVMKHAVALDVSTNTDKNLRWLMQKRSKYSMYFYLDRQKIAIQTVKSAFDCLMGQKYYHILPFYGCCAVYLNSEGVPLEIKKNELQNHVLPEGVTKKLAILLRNADHFIVNTKQLLGAQVQRMEHLQKLGFIPIEVRANEFLYTERYSREKSMELLQSYLAEHIDFEKVEQFCERAELYPEASEQRQFQFWSEYEDEAELSSDEDDNTLFKGDNKEPSGITVEDSGLLKDGREGDHDDDSTKDPK